jgi:hypothetical protein
MTRQSFSLTNMLLATGIIATLFGWYIDHLILERELSTHRMLDGNFEERTEVVRKRAWTKSERDAKLLLFLLTDPYPQVVIEAESQLRRVFRDSNHLPDEEERTRVEGINVWSSCLLQENIGVANESKSAQSNHSRSTTSNGFDPDPFGNGTFEEVFILPR